MTRAWTIPFLIVVVVGCSSDPPPGPVPLKTSTMQAAITVVGDGATTKSNIVILAGDTLMDHFVLGMGDTLTTTKAMGMATPMAMTGMGMTLAYEAAFPGMDPEGTMYTIAFKRTADGGAPNNIAVMPAPIALSLPADGASFSRATDDIVVNYAPSGFGDPVTWFIEATCAQVAGMQGVTGDSGNFTIARAGIKNAGAGGTCMATLTVYRTRKGTIDPGFGKGGTVTAQQIARVSITSKP